MKKVSGRGFSSFYHHYDQCYKDKRKSTSTKTFATEIQKLAETYFCINEVSAHNRAVMVV